MTSTRRRDTLITFQRSTTAEDEYGEDVQVWGDLGQAFTAVFYGKGDERRGAGDQSEGNQAATFNVPANGLTRTLLVRDRIALGGDAWDIFSIAPIGRDEIDIDARRVKA